MKDTNKGMNEFQRGEQVRHIAKLLFTHIQRGPRRKCGTGFS
ncbi:MAG: hypothetical protein ACK4OM_02210 [Alphaproteobacteria bacterium]